MENARSTKRVLPRRSSWKQIWTACELTEQLRLSQTAAAASRTHPLALDLLVHVPCCIVSKGERFAQLCPVKSPVLDASPDHPQVQALLDLTFRNLQARPIAIPQQPSRQHACRFNPISKRCNYIGMQGCTPQHGRPAVSNFERRQCLLAGAF